MATDCEAEKHVDWDAEIEEAIEVIVELKKALSGLAGELLVVCSPGCRVPHLGPKATALMKKGLFRHGRPESATCFWTEDAHEQWAGDCGVEVPADFLVEAKFCMNCGRIVEMVYYEDPNNVSEEEDGA